MKTNFLSFLILGILLTSCMTGGKPDNFDYGKVENGKYVNSFFNFEITLPDDWSVQSKEQIDDLTKQGGDLIAGDNKIMKAQIKASEINTANLLMAYQYELGTPVDYNPSISIVAENIKNTPGIKTGADYLFQTRKLLLQSQLSYDHIDETAAKEDINGTVFYKIDATITYLGIEIHQTYYSTILNGFSFALVVSYINEEQHEVLLESIKSMKFSK